MRSDTLEQMVRQQSPFGHLKGWKLAHFIVKAGDDLRMEALAMQVRQPSPSSLRKACVAASDIDFPAQSRASSLLLTNSPCILFLLVKAIAPRLYFLQRPTTSIHGNIDGINLQDLFATESQDKQALTVKSPRHLPRTSRVKAVDPLPALLMPDKVIRLVDSIFKREGLSLRLRPYAIMACGDKKGLVECITDAKSIDHIKKGTIRKGGMRVSVGRSRHLPAR